MESQTRSMRSGASASSKVGKTVSWDSEAARFAVGVFVDVEARVVVPDAAVVAAPEDAAFAPDFLRFLAFGVGMVDIVPSASGKGKCFLTYFNEFLKNWGKSV